VEIECLACGKPIKIPPCVDTEKYDGQVVCQECNSLLHIKLVKEKVQKYKVVENKRERDIKLEFVPAKELLEEQKKLETREKELKES